MRAPLIVVLGLGFTPIWIALLGYGSFLPTCRRFSAETGNFAGHVRPKTRGLLMKVLKCLSSHRYIGPGCFMGGLQEQFQADSPIEASVPHQQQMGKMSKAKTATDALHAELYSAIADLAKSVDIAVTQMKLRAQCTATIANATKVEHAAELLRATATQSAAKRLSRPALFRQCWLSLNRVRKKTRAKRRSSPRDVPPSKAVEDLDATCKRLTMAQPHHKKKDQPAESAIAMRILELHDRFGGLINNKPA